MHAQAQIASFSQSVSMRDYLFEIVLLIKGIFFFVRTKVVIEI
jgi:hypothetical protein